MDRTDRATEVHPQAAFRIGRSKVEITPVPRGQLLLGWWDPKHRARSIGAPLFIRCIWIKDESGKSVVFFQFDLCYISENLNRALVEKILSDESLVRDGITADVLHFSAIHTHAAPGGYCAEAVYQIGSLGMDFGWIEQLCDSALRALRAAAVGQTPARMKTSFARISASENYIYNRALAAQEKNPDVPHDSSWVDGTWREFPVWRFESVPSESSVTVRPLALISFLGLHGTCIHQDQHLIHPDHKGLSSLLTESRLGQEDRDFIALYLQGAGGDITPNFQVFDGIPWSRGVFRNDLESVQWVAERQSESVERVDWEEVSGGPASVVRPKIDVQKSIVQFFDPLDFAAGRVGPAVGSPSLFGTREGHGVGFERLFARFLKWYTRKLPISVEQQRIHHPKKIVVDGASRRLTLFKLDEKFWVPPTFIHPMFKVMRGWRTKNLHLKIPLLPVSQCISLTRLGNHFVLACPGEFTVIAALRMKREVVAGLRDEGVAIELRHVTFLGYTNGYGGYVTTPEEYAVQLYEGASTIYGRESLNTYRKVAQELARRIAKSSRLDASVSM